MRKAVADGIFLARDLINEPANTLGPVEFAERMRELASAGLEVEVLELEQLQALKMNALLGGRNGEPASLPGRRAAMARCQVQARQNRCALSARAFALTQAAFP